MFGSFLGSFYTGGIRIPLRTTDENFVGLWLGLLLMRDLFKAFLTFMHGTELFRLKRWLMYRRPQAFGHGG